MKEQKKNTHICVSICNNAQARTEMQAQWNRNEQRFKCDFIICANVSVLNICALTSDLFMAQFRHGFASLFHTRAAHTKTVNHSQREKRNLIEFRRFLPIRAHISPPAKPCKICYKWYISSDERCICAVVLMWATDSFFSVDFVWSLVFLAFNTVHHPSVSMCANVFTLSLQCSKWSKAVRNLFIIYYQTFNNSFRTIRFTSIVRINRRFSMSLFFFFAAIPYNGHIIC